MVMSHEEKITMLKAEIFDLNRERKRILLSLAGLNEVIEKKIAELERFEKNETEIN